jgi:serine carboxypeptidase-like clade 1
MYYNTPEVREAIHAAPLESSGRWEPCSDVLHYKNSPESLVHVHRELLDAGLQALIFSGDHDYVVPYTGTRDWVWSMDLRVARGWEWGAWYLEGRGQVGGYAVRFEEGLTFATVKGAGHMVPQTSPEAAQQLLQLWLGRKL